MSGGHFDYEDQRLTQCIDQLKKDLRKAKKAVKPDSEYDTYYFHYESKETFQFVKKLIKKAERLRKALHEYDWFVSGDTDEEFFLEKYKEIYQKKDKKVDTVAPYLGNITWEIKNE